jgi:UPF0755 protein
VPLSAVLANGSPADAPAAEWGAEPPGQGSNHRLPAASAAPGRGAGGGAKKTGGPFRRGLVIGLVILAVALVLGGVIGYQRYFAAPDYDGDGQGDVIIQVRDGDTTRAIGAELATDGVVLSGRAFTRAAEDYANIRAVQPGYYRMRLRMSGDSAVALLMSPSTRVGQLDIKGGVQLDDTQGPNGVASPGVLSLISRATCTQLNGVSTCVPVPALRTAMATTPPAELGVPDWALTDVSKAEPNRRLEGLIAPGRYDVRPGASAQEVLRTLVANSANQYAADGLTSLDGQHKYRPYQLLIIASLVEREGIGPDFGKIARVIYNRLGNRVRLELDSTVNYPLDRQAVRTNASDRARPGAYNSYANYGLPPTPIGAPGDQAIQATLNPTPGPWMFFVKCQRTGASCFSTTLQQHVQNVNAAVAAGAF